MSPFSVQRARSSLRLYGRTFGLFIAMGLGALFTEARVLSPLIPWLVAMMLFLASLDLRLGPGALRTGVWKIFAAELILAILGYAALAAVDRDLALVAFLTAITPTAISAPVIIGFLGGRVDYVVTSVLLTNVAVALALPLLLPLATGAGGQIAPGEVFGAVCFVVLVPLALARCAAWLPAAAGRAIARAKPLSFPLWLVALLLVTAKSVYVVGHEETVTGGRLLAIAAVAFGVCVASFALGALLGGRTYRREASQSLGQKNNSFTIWIALTFVSPVVALGPTCYVLYHNVYNSLQLMAHERRRARSGD